MQSCVSYIDEILCRPKPLQKPTKTCCMAKYACAMSKYACLIAKYGLTKDIGTANILPASEPCLNFPACHCRLLETYDMQYIIEKSFA